MNTLEYVIEHAIKKHKDNTDTPHFIDYDYAGVIIDNIVRWCIHNDIPLSILEKQYPEYAPRNRRYITVEDAKNIPRILRFIEMDDIEDLFYVHNRIEHQNKLLDKWIEETYNGTMIWRTKKLYIGTDQMATKDFDFGIYKRDLLMFRPYDDLSIDYVTYIETDYGQNVRLVNGGISPEIDAKILNLVKLAYSTNDTLKLNIERMARYIANRYTYKK